MSRTGYLGVKTATWLLAVWAVARDPRPWSDLQTAAWLEPHQARLFAAATATLRPQRKWLLERLGLRPHTA